MKNDGEAIVMWIKAHRKELIVAGFGIAFIVAMGIKNRKNMEAFFESLKAMINKTPKSVCEPTKTASVIKSSTPIIAEISIDTQKRIPHNVSEHLRDLPKGWKPSAEKVATAAEHGFKLNQGQTWVEKYRTGGLAA